MGAGRATPPYKTQRRPGGRPRSRGWKQASEASGSKRGAAGRAGVCEKRGRGPRPRPSSGACELLTMILRSFPLMF